MVVTDTEVMLVSPVLSPVPRAGWGVVQNIVFLQVSMWQCMQFEHSAPPIQDVDFASDPADRSCLFLTIQQSLSRKRPALPPKFQFQDQISCMAAKKCLLNHKEKLRVAKMSRINRLFKFPDPMVPTIPVNAAAEDDTSSNSPVSIYSIDDSDTNQAAIHSTFMSDQRLAAPPHSHYIELATLSSPPHHPSIHTNSRSDDDADVHLDSSSLQAIIRIHKSKTQQDNEKIGNVPQEGSHGGDKEETEQQL